jgi:hypothetical protein
MARFQLAPHWCCLDPEGKRCSDNVRSANPSLVFSVQKAGSIGDLFICSLCRKPALTSSANFIES